MAKKFLISFIVSLLIFALLYGVLYFKVENNQSMLERLESRLDVAPVENIEEGNKIAPIKLDEIMFLVVGVDTSDLSNIDKEDGSTGIRSDTMMLCKVNFEDGSITIMSIPRDTRVPIRGTNDKLNHAHSYGGMKLLLQTIRDFTDLDLDYYVRVDYNAVMAIVDAIGGIELEIKEPMHYEDTTEGKELFINFEPGVQTLDGDQAIEFLRYREYKDGDIARIQNQQYFITELIKQTLTPRNILRLPQLFDAYLKYVDTNIDSSIIYKGISLAGNMDSESIETLTLPGYGAEDPYTGVSYYYLQQPDADLTIEEYFGDYIITENMDQDDNEGN